jgi:hypothetical protein
MLRISKIVSISACKSCGTKDITFGPPKGHLDTQMFPECEGSRFDRDIVKKTVEKRKRDRKKQTKQNKKK